jgi:phosphoserine phosphatase
VNLVATLIAAPAEGSALVDVAVSLAGAGATVDWLAEAEALDLRPGDGPGSCPFPRSVTELLAALRDRIGRRPLDVVVQDAARRRKKLLVADMDSTMIAEEGIDELADFVGLKKQVAAITARAMRGEIEFEPALRERVALLAELPASVLDRLLSERIHPRPGAAELVATMRASGAHTILVSGGFAAIAGPIAARLGFDHYRANRLVIDDGRLTGKVEDPILGRDAKRSTLIAFRQNLGLDVEDTLAVGDGANDLSMIAEAGLGVAFHAQSRVAEAAPARIDHADLTALLFLQGYRRSDFISPAHRPETGPVISPLGGRA